MQRSFFRLIRAETVRTLKKYRPRNLYILHMQYRSGALSRRGRTLPAPVTALVSRRGPTTPVGFNFCSSEKRTFAHILVSDSLLASGQNCVAAQQCSISKLFSISETSRGPRFHCISARVFLCDRDDCNAEDSCVFIGRSITGVCAPRDPSILHKVRVCCVRMLYARNLVAKDSRKLARKFGWCHLLPAVS